MVGFICGFEGRDLVFFFIVSLVWVIVLLLICGTREKRGTRVFFFLRVRLGFVYGFNIYFFGYLFMGLYLFLRELIVCLV